MTMEQLKSLRSGTLQRLQSSELFRRLMGTSINKNIYAGYLINVYHYAKHSARVISLAGSRCVTSHPQLAAYLMRHATEEIGHEEWAHSDLLELGVSEQRIAESRPGVSCTSMIGMEYYVAGYWNPVALFGWLFVLEALGDDVGGLVAKKLDASLQLAGKGSYFLAGHSEADHDHIKDITDTIEKYMKDERDIADMLHIAQTSCELYLGILQEAVCEERVWV